MKMTSYGYVCKQFYFRGSPKTSSEEQKQNIQKQFNPHYIFVEEDSSKERKAFNILLSQLKKGDRVLIWNMSNFIDEERKDQGLLDVLSRVQLVHDKGAHILFMRSDCRTDTALGRLAMTTLLANEQYNFDIEPKEKESSCCSSTSVDSEKSHC